MNKYQSYKPSGVEWIGDIPLNWSLKRICFVFRPISIKNNIGEINLSVYRDYGVIPTDSRDDNHNTISEDTSNYKLVQVGDFVMNKMKCWMGSLGLSDYRGIVSPSYTVMRPINNENRKYLHYLLRSQLYIPQYRRLSYGVRIGQWDMRFEDFRDLPCVIPPLQEQLQIVQFLDEKTELIDKLISTKERKITLLKEQRTSLINEVVTKGLNPNVKMKDSGVEWIGEIPEGWKITKLKYLVTFDSGYSFNSSDYVDEGVNLIRIGSLYDNTLDLERSPVFLPIQFLNQHQNFVVKKNDILISLTGTLGKRDYGYSIVYDKDFPSLLNQRVGRLKLKSEDLNFKLFTSILHSEYYLNQLFCKPTGTKQGNFSSDDIISNYIFLPPNQEQHQIVEYLDSKTKEIDDLVQLEQKKIDLLKEYRQSLISEVVTGKVKVTQ